MWIVMFTMVRYGFAAMMMGYYWDSDGYTLW